MSIPYELDDIENTSGMGKYSHVPPSVSREFNVGVFCFNYFWLVYYRQRYFSLLYCICFALFIIPALRFLSILVYFGLGLAFGRFGNTWAWRARRYPSVENFHSTHRKIAIVGVILQIILFAFILRFVPIDAREAMRLDFPQMYYFERYWNGEDENNMQNANPIRQVEEITKNADEKALQLKILKVLSTLSTVVSTQAISGDIPENISTSDFVSMFKSKMTNVESYNEKIIKTADGSTYQFESDGGKCLNNACYILIDVNGVENGPNKFWKKDGPVSDRLRINIKRNEHGMLNLEVPNYVTESKTK